MFVIYTGFLYMGFLERFKLACFSFVLVPTLVIGCHFVTCRVNVGCEWVMALALSLMSHRSTPLALYLSGLIMITQPYEELIHCPPPWYPIGQVGLPCSLRSDVGPMASPDDPTLPLLTVSITLWPCVIWLHHYIRHLHCCNREITTEV